MKKPALRATTVLAVRKDGRIALGGDGQVTLGDTIMKATAQKVRTLKEGKILAGFAGSAVAFGLARRRRRRLTDPGDALSAVFVVSPGLPQVEPERELLLVEIAAPEDWSGSVDMDPDDYKGTATNEMPTGFHDPLEFLDKES